MPLLGRARYNLLQRRVRSDSTFQVPFWQIKEYRKLEINTLFASLEELGISLSEKSFALYAENFDSPEAFVESLPIPSPEKKEEIFLYFFEIWKRLLPSKETLTLFCDDLDYLQELYENHAESSEELLATKLFELADILDYHVDQDKDAKTVLQEIAPYFAFDLDSFLYNFLFDQMEKQNSSLASGLLDRFYIYMEDNLWFAFLRIKLLQGIPSEETTTLISLFLENLYAAFDLDLALEFLHYLIKTGYKDLFYTTYQEITRHLKTTQEYHELLKILLDFCTLHHLTAEASSVRSLLFRESDV